MTRTKLTATISSPVIERLNQRKGRNLSAEVEWIISQHLKLVEIGRARLRERFTRPEMMAIMDAMNGCFWDAGLLPIMLQAGIAANVADWPAKALGEKWGVDGDGLVRKLADLPDLDRYALLDLVHEFWNRAEEPADELLADFEPALPEGPAPM